MKIDVKHCPRCHTSHNQLDFMKFSDQRNIPISYVGNEIPYWSMCPLKNEPVLLDIDPTTLH